MSIEETKDLQSPLQTNNYKMPTIHMQNMHAQFVLCAQNYL